MVLQIQPLEQRHWPRVRAIYAEGIATGQATFETEPPAWEGFSAGRPWGLVALEGDEVAAWATLSPVSGRCVYGGVCEVAVYVGAARRGQGVGRALLTALIELSEKEGHWTLQAGVFPENPASLALHEGLGFRRVGTRERIGKLGDVWRDVVLLERRSPRVGV